MKIVKWYLDCIAEDGETFVAYAARIGSRGVSLGHASSLHLRPGHDVVTASTLRDVIEPVREGEAWAWVSGPLAVDGRWVPCENALRERLYDNAGLCVDWSCAAPGADVTLTLDRRTIRGRGYVERIETTGAPWRLPIRELRWGRFLAASASLVWIEWRGPHPLQRVFLDGRPIGAEIGKHDVRSLDGKTHLDLDGGTVLSDGEIVTGVLRDVPVLRSIVPVRVRDTHDRKVVSRGVLTRADGTTTQGFAIHETVQFAGTLPGTI